MTPIDRKTDGKINAVVLEVKSYVKNDKHDAATSEKLRKDLTSLLAANPTAQQKQRIAIPSKVSVNSIRKINRGSPEGLNCSLRNRGTMNKRLGLGISLGAFRQVSLDAALLTIIKWDEALQTKRRWPTLFQRNNDLR